MNDAALETAIARYFADAEVHRSCTRDVELARYVAAELSGSEAEAFTAHAARCADCTATLDDLADTAHAWGRAPSNVVPFPRRFVRLFAAPALALAASLCLFVLWNRPVDGDRLVPKGAWSLELAVQRGGQQFLAPSGAQLLTGDQLGFFYSSPREGWLTVLYADTSGAPLRIFPARSSGSAKVAAGQNVALADGAVLEAGQGCEWVVGLFTPAPLTGEQAQARVREMIAGRKGCTLPEQADARVVVVKRSP